MFGVSVTVNVNVSVTVILSLTLSNFLREIFHQKKIPSVGESFLYFTQIKIILSR
jgi:hypothetical protein